MPSVLAQTQVSFEPATVNLAVGESALVAVSVSDLPASGLAGLQLRIELDSAVATVRDPNAAFVPGVMPWTPLGGDPQCATVRGVPTCTDPVWLLTQTGRTAVVGLDTTGAAGEYAAMAFGTYGSAALPIDSGVIALIEIVAQNNGQTTASLAQSLLADAAQIPTAIPVSIAALTVNVGGVPDSDGDGVADDLDNCTDVVNPGQNDTDADGFGNICDPDYNNDGIVNVIDLGLLKQAFFSADSNIDLNGDGVVNAIDLGILKSFFFQAPGPGAGVPRPAVAAAPQDAPFIAVDNLTPVTIVPAQHHARRGRAVSIDASSSFDPDLDSLDFRWRPLEWPPGARVPAESSGPVLRYWPDSIGRYVFEIVVADGFSASSSQVVVLVSDEDKANPTDPRFARLSSEWRDAQGQLTGAVAATRIEQKGDRVLVTANLVPGDESALLWSLVAAPSGSALSTSDIAGRLQQRASMVPDVAGTYLVRLDVAGEGRHHFKQLLIEVH